ncbi:MAG: ABC transporter ATP-binding protein [Butyrivibrio sp.]|nr:ABC transporter ATP-binding protein [Butyrivibrio sp.]
MRFDLTSGLRIITLVLTTIGYWKIFGKCGIKKYWALVPLAREYHIALCADREEDGRKYMYISVISFVFGTIVTYANLQDPVLVLMALIMAVSFAIANLIYTTRIYTGLTETFGRSKKWVVLMVLFEAVTICYWGVSKKFIPVRKIESLDVSGQAKTLGTDVDNIKDGLTVNINERSVIDLFKKKILLKDIHMRIPKGHMVLLLGGSGAGKTTYLNAVTGYEKADASITLGDNDIYKDYDKMMYDIGFVPQQDLMRGNDTVALTLSDAATLRLPTSVSFAEKNERISQVLEQFGLTAVKNSLVEKLSGGQRKRLSIAMEFISDPSLFILDEPDSGLDGVVARGLFEKLRSIADEGKIVVVITHTPDRVIDLFDDVIVLAKDAGRTGRLAYYGPVKEAYEFFGKSSMEEILLSINQKDEGGEGRADEFVEKYADYMRERVG